MNKDARIVDIIRRRMNSVTMKDVAEFVLETVRIWRCISKKIDFNYGTSPCYNRKIGNIKYWKDSLETVAWREGLILQIPASQLWNAST